MTCADVPDVRNGAREAGLMAYVAEKHATAEVEAAVRRVLRDQDRWPVTLLDVRRAASGVLSGGVHWTCNPATAAIIARVVSQLASAGELVKISRGEDGPDGYRNRTRQPTLYTPAAYREAVAAHQDREAAARRDREEYGIIWDELARRGYTPVVPRSHPEQLGRALAVAAWRGLLGMDRNQG